MIEKFKDIQPLTGAIRHCGIWLTGTNEDIVYHNPSYKPSDAVESVIYCVPGTADGNTAFCFLTENIFDLLPNTISSIHLLAFSNRYHGLGIDDFANELKEKAKANKHTNIILMGHSRGGLVCAYFREYLAALSGIKVNKVFAIGSPFYGSDLALPPLSWFSSSVNQMQTGSEFLKPLRKLMKLNPNVYHFFAAEKDSIVSLNSAYVHKLSHALTVLDKHGHLSIMSSKRLADSILKTLWDIMPELSQNTACAEIEEYLNKFQHKGHLSDANYKVAILQRLTTFLMSVENYPLLQDKSIGTLINAFLNKKQSNGQKLYDTLNEALNFPFSFGDTDTFNFVSVLVIKYKNVPIKPEHPLEKDVLESEKMEEKKSFSSI